MLIGLHVTGASAVSLKPPVRTYRKRPSPLRALSMAENEFTVTAVCPLGVNKLSLPAPSMR